MLEQASDMVRKIWVVKYWYKRLELFDGQVQAVAITVQKVIY